MIQRHLLFAPFLILLTVTDNLAFGEEIQPVELFHYCINGVEDENGSEKSPVLLLHGFLGTHNNYAGVDQVIAERTKRKVCSVDLRNHGDSPWNNRTDIAALAADIGNFLDTQNIKKVNLIGESLGGKVAIHYTLNNPDRIDSLVTEDIRPNGMESRPTLMIIASLLFLKKMIDSQPEDMNEEEAKEWFVHSLHQGLKMLGTTDKLPEDASYLFSMHFVNGRWESKHNMKLFMEKMNNRKELLTESLGLYTGPTLFIYGTESVFKVKEDEENILKLFPNAKLVAFDNAGHILHENPDYRPKFEDIIEKFLNEIN